MRGAWISVAMVTACAAPSGLTIEIVATEGVTRVELFIAKHCDGECPGKVAPPATPELPAKLFEVDHAMMWGASVDGDVAGFLIVADGADEQTISLLAAVGYAGDTAVATAMVSDVKIVPGASEYWRIELAEAGALDPASAPEDGAFRLAQWRRPKDDGAPDDETLPSCVVIEHRTDGRTERFAIGPETDEDCDAVMSQPECRPWSYRATATTSGSIDQANCITMGSVGTRNACLASGPACSEVTVLPQTCSRVTDDYCVTAQLCECPTWDPDCLLTRAKTAAYWKCVIPLDAQGAPCTTPTTITGVSVCDVVGFGAPSAASCTAVRIHELGPTIGPFGGIADFVRSKLEITHNSPPDLIDLEWMGMPTVAGEMALLSLDLDNLRHIVIPLLISFEPNGCAPAYCEPFFDSTTDVALACATTPPAPAMCQAQSPCPSGPLCGNMCCGTGEQCIDDVCHCGTGPACTDGECAAGAPGPCGMQCCGGNTGVDCLF